MELWASGFNAWNQLQFDGELPAQPRDLTEFTCVLKDNRVDVLRASLSATLVRTTSGLRTAGYPDEFTKIFAAREDDLLIAIAGNDKISENTSRGTIQYDSLQAFAAQDGTVLALPQGIQQICSNQTGFTALLADGTVYTWGDGRYEACLGREVTDESPASTPSIVQELSEIPDKVMKISSGGYVTAALTAGNNIYIWGRQGHPELSEPLTGSPMPLDLEGLDFRDVAVGLDHVMLLTTERRILVVGAGGNGQLGLGSEVKKVKDWREVKIPLKHGQQAVKLHTGYKNSFVIVDNTT